MARDYSLASAQGEINRLRRLLAEEKSAREAESAKHKEALRGVTSKYMLVTRERNDLRRQVAEYERVIEPVRGLQEVEEPPVPIEPKPVPGARRCPYCGGYPVAAGSLTQGPVYLQCPSCHGRSMLTATLERARERWNRFNPVGSERRIDAGEQTQEKRT